MRKIPELLLKCCGIIHKPHSIKILDDCIKITFRCHVCRNWLYFEIKDGMNKMLVDIELTRHSSVVKSITENHNNHNNHNNHIKK